MKLWPASNSFLALLLSLSVLSAAEPTLTLKSPIAQSVLQRQSVNTGRVEVIGEVHGMDQAYVSPIVEIRVDGGAWQRLILSAVERNRTDTTFTGAVELAKGMHTLEVRAVRDGQPLASAPSVKFGIGEVIVVTGQSNSANHGAVKTKATSDQVFTLTPKGTWQSCADPQPGLPAAAVVSYPPSATNSKSASVFRSASSPVALVQRAYANGSPPASPFRTRRPS